MRQSGRLGSFEAPFSLLVKNFLAYAIYILANLLGGGSLAIFLFFLVNGPFNLIDLGLTELGILGLDALLCLAFFIQHSVMIRQPFRRWESRAVPSYYQGAVYTLASGIVLLMLTIMWQNSAHTVIIFVGTGRWLLYTTFFLAAAGIIWCTWALRTLDMFGLDQIMAHVNNRQLPIKPLIANGPYRWVRHPIYFFMLVMIWSCPYLTLDRLLFNGLWSIWIVIGTVLEDHDLATGFGPAYHDYQRKVPILIPWRIRPLK